MRSNLKYSDLEVQSSLNSSLLQALSGNPVLLDSKKANLYSLKLVNDFAGI